MSRQPFRKTPESLRTVRAMASYGIPQPEIARVLGVDAKTLRKHFRDVLDVAATEANAVVAQGLFRAATAWMDPPAEGRRPTPLTREAVIAMLFWLKARAGWSERISVDATSRSTAKNTTTAEVSITTNAADREAVEALSALERLLAAGGGATAGVAGQGAA